MNMGFQHPGQQQSKIKGKLAAARSKKTPLHLRAHLAQQAQPGTARGLNVSPPATQVSPLKMKEMAAPAMPKGRQNGRRIFMQKARSPIYG